MDNCDYEGKPCENCGTTMEIVRHGDCSCHLHPPCGNCVEAKIECPECGWVPAMEESWCREN